MNRRKLSINTVLSFLLFGQQCCCKQIVFRLKVQKWYSVSFRKETGSLLAQCCCSERNFRGRKSVKVQLDFQKNTSDFQDFYVKNGSVWILLSCKCIWSQETSTPCCEGDQSKRTSWWSAELLQPMLATPLWLHFIPVVSEVLLMHWWSRQPVFSAGHGDPVLLKGYCHQRERKKMSALG